MSLRGSDGLTRFGLLALPLAGLLALVGLYSSVQLGWGGILASGDNQAIVCTGLGDTAGAMRLFSRRVRHTGAPSVTFRIILPGSTGRASRAA